MAQAVPVRVRPSAPRLAAGIDPGLARKAESSVDADSFEAVAREWHAKRAPGWAPGHAEKVLGRLAHGERAAVRAAYNYAEHLPERRQMMQAWADYLDSLKVALRWSRWMAEWLDRSGLSRDQKGEAFRGDPQQSQVDTFHGCLSDRGMVGIRAERR